MPEEIKLILTVEEQQFIRDMRSAQSATKKATEGFESAKGKLVTLNAAMQLGAQAARFLADGLRTASDFIVDTTQAASDLEEETNKFRVVFNQVGAEAQEVAKNLQEAYGLSRRESLQLLAATGDLLTGFGFAGDRALELSKQVNELAVDLASFTNFAGGAEGASNALTKALLGEREAVKSLGISIQEQDVQARLQAEGKAELTGLALRQAKAEVTLQIALEQSRNAVGDYARSQGSFANQNRLLQSQIENLRSAIGEAFLPVLNELQKQVIALIGNTSEWAEANKALITSGIVQFMVRVFEVTRVVAQGFAQLLIAIDSVRLLFADLGIAVQTANSAIVISMGDAVAAVLNFINDLTRGSIEAVESLLSSVAALSSAFSEELAGKVDIATAAIQQFKAEMVERVDDSDIRGLEAQFEAEIQASQKARDEIIQNTIDTEQQFFSLANTIDSISSKIAGIPVGDTEADTGTGAPGPTSTVDIGAEVENQKKALEERRKLLETFYELTGEAEFMALEARLEREKEAIALAHEEGIVGAKEAKMLEEEAILAVEEEARQIRLEREQEDMERKLENLNLFQEAMIESFEITGNAAADASDTVNSLLVGAFQKTEGAVVKTFQEMRKGGADGKKIFKELGNAIIDDVIGALVRVGIQYVLNNLLVSQAGASGVKAGAAQAFSNAFAATAIIPIIGPALAPAVAAAAGAAALSGGLGFLSAPTLGSRQFGDDAIPQEGLYRLHAGERVVPQQTNHDLTSFLRDQANLSRESRSGSGNSVNINITGDVIGEEDFIDQLAEKINVAREFRGVELRT